MINKKVQFLFALIFLMSCSQEKFNESITNIDNLETIKIDEKQFSADSSINVSSIIESVKYVKLELPPDILIGDVFNFLVDERNQRIYLSDQRKVYIFSLSGSLVNIISSIGEGPTEYSTISYIDFAPNSRELVLYDQAILKLLYYDIDGVFKESKRLEFPTDVNFGILNDNHLTFDFRNLQGMPGINTNLIIVDSTLQITDSYIPFTEDRLLGTHFYSRSAIGKLSYTQTFNDTIYSFSEDNRLHASYFIDFGSYSMPKNTGPLSGSDILGNGSYTSYVGQIYRVQETDNLLFFQYLHESMWKYFIYDKINKVKQYGILYDNIGIGFLLNSYSLSNRQFYSLANTEIIWQRHENMKDRLNEEEYEKILADYPDINEILKEAKSGKDDSNPYLVISDLKNL